MPITIDKTEAPHYLRIAYEGAAPSPAEQDQERARLIADGALTSDTKALLDLRGLTVLPTLPELRETVDDGLLYGGLPRRRAYVVLPWMHLSLVRAIEAQTSGLLTIAAFMDEAAAAEWLARLDD